MSKDPSPSNLLAQASIASAALSASPRIKSAACFTPNIHCASKPTGDERTCPKNSDQDNDVQEKVPQTLRISNNVIW